MPKKQLIVLILLVVLIIEMGSVNSITISDGTMRKQGAGLRVFSNLAPVYPVAQNVGMNKTDSIVVQNIGDEPLTISLTYSIYPQELQGKIYLSFEPNNFVLDPGTLLGVAVNIIVESGAYVGVYNVSITVRGYTSVDNGNPVVITSVVTTVILVGQYSYKLSVILKQPDGTPTMGIIKVSYYYQGGYIPLYQVKASNYTFFVIEGRYLVEAYLGGMKRASQEVDVYQDTVVSLTYSSIYVKEFSIIFEPQKPKDSLIFRVSIQNDDPLIYKKDIAVTVNLRNESGLIVRNLTIARLTIRSVVVKDILGFIKPPDLWSNGTYDLEVLIYSRSRILYNYSTTFHIVVIAPVHVELIQQIPFQYVLLLTAMGILFGFFGAKFALLKVRGKIIPKVVGLIYGRDYVAYSAWTKAFEDPEFVSGDWSKAIYGYRILARRYLKPKAKEREKAERVVKFLVLTLNAEKWIFVPLIQEITMFLCVHSSLNEYDILDKIEKLANYFKSKITNYGVHSLLINPEESLEDLGKTVEKLFK